MRKTLLCLLAIAVCLAAAPRKPKLVLAVVFDQFRYDYLAKYRSEYHAAFHRLLTKGAVFTDARYQHYPTVTAIGHSTFLSGALPSISGIVGNDWYDREAQLQVTSVSDPETKLVGGFGGAGSSPKRMLVSTVGDELKIADGGKSHVIGISLKDRAAILPSGHMANGAYWFDGASGNFVSSSYYFETAPDWVKSFNDARPADRFAGATWLDHTMPQDTDKVYAAIPSSPYGNELIEAFAERALDGEQLGKHEAPDVLAVSFSSNDYIGHEYGPDSPEVREISVRSDRLLAKLLEAIDKQVGLDNVLVVMTADHGVAPVPEVNEQRHMPGGRLTTASLAEAVQNALQPKYGKFEWITSNLETGMYLNWELIRLRKLDVAEVTRTAAEALRHVPHVFRVFTREDLMHGQIQQDPVGRRVLNGYNAARGADLEVLLDPYWVTGAATGTSKASHSTPFGYDTHVPLIFMGAGIKPGRYDMAVTINDVAPTLANILDVETPSGSVGRVLFEMFE
jgi:predicted AlkP superfamily pyrophosphatase or phosphodiesterase